MVECFSEQTDSGIWHSATRVNGSAADTERKDLIGKIHGGAWYEDTGSEKQRE